MERTPIRRRTGTILTILVIAVILLSSCGSSGSPGSDKRAARSFLKQYQVETSAEEGLLYDLTLLSYQESESLCAYGLFDETHLLLLSAENSADKDTASTFTARLWDLRDGSFSDLASFEKTDVVPGEPSDALDLEILSADPLLVYDRSCGVLYRPGCDPAAVILPEWLLDSTLYCIEGHTWLSSDRGILYAVRENGALEAVWTLPCEYGAFTPVVCGHEGKLTFATYSRQVPSERIFVDVDPFTGESEFYLSNLEIGRFLVYTDGLLLGTSFRTAPKVSVCSLSSGVKKELELPEQIGALLRGESDGLSPDDGFVSFSTVPLSVRGDWCTFMLKDSHGYPARIYLWDTENCSDSPWSVPSDTSYEAPEASDYGELSRTAAALEERYGVRIILGDNVPSEFTDYTAESVTDHAIMEGSLAVLENVLSLYPSGYFTALRGNYFRGVALYLTGALMPLNADSNISNASAFATESNGLMQIAFDLYDDLDPSTVIHELTHAADYRLIGEGLFDEDRWNAMNPDGFSYYYSYIDENGESYELTGSDDLTAAGDAPADEVYFIDPYSKTFPMEDRARLMENLLSGKSPYSYCYGGAHVQEKLSYYFRFLRETIGDETWPAVTAWEKALSDAASP